MCARCGGWLLSGDAESLIAMQRSRASARARGDDLFRQRRCAGDDDFLAGFLDWIVSRARSCGFFDLDLIVARCFIDEPEFCERDS